MAYKHYSKGSKVETNYGQGVVTKIRPDDGVCVVQLDYGTMYIRPDVYPIRRAMTTQELNADFEALEKMRKLNLEVECSENGILHCDHAQCKKCLLANPTAHKTKTSSLSSSFLPSIPNPLASKKKITPCLLCASPTCTQHSSKGFAKERVTLCVDCEGLFQKEMLHQDLAPQQLSAHLERMTDAYDRAFLLLRYSLQFVPPLMEQLHAEAARDDNMTLGTSSVGFVSGAMGFAGAAAILTPAGPPLLMASFVFGTSNAAVGLGYSAKKHYYLQAGPTEVANKLIALFGFLQAILEAIVTFREQINADPTCANVQSSSSSQKDQGQQGRNAYLEALSQGISATKTTNTGLRVGNAVGYTATSNVFEFLGATPVIGQAFSAAMMVMDYQTASQTLEKIKAGSKSDKARALQNIQQELLGLPLTSDLEIEVENILRALSSS